MPIAEISRAKLETPIPVYVIDPPHIMAYTSGQPIGRSMVFQRSYLYPVSVDGVPKSWFRVDQRSDNTWEVVELDSGDNLLGELLDQGKKLMQGTTSEKLLCIEMPGVASFVGRFTKDDVALAALFNDPEFGVEEGKIISAKNLIVHVGDVLRSNTINNHALAPR
jgi:hypothetical protein